MTTSGRPKLGDVFRGEGTDRTEGLAGLLPTGPSARPTSDEPAVATPLPDVHRPLGPDASHVLSETVRSKEDGRSAPTSRGSSSTSSIDAPTLDETDTIEVLAPTTPSRRPRKLTVKPVSAPTNRDDTSAQVRDTSVKMVPANIDVSVHQELRRFAIRTELSFAVVALRAIEANAFELSQMWHNPPARPRAGLFGSVDERPGNRRAEPAAQVQLRLQVTDAAVLDGLVSEWGAPSRSALVNEALRRYLQDSNKSVT